MEDLEADPDDAGEEEQADDVRVDERVQQACEEARLGRIDVGAREVQHVGPFCVLRFVAVELHEQRRQRRSDEIDHMHVKGLLRREVGGHPHGFGRPGRIALVRRRERGE